MIAALYFEQQTAAILGITRKEIKYVRDEVLKKEAGWRMHGREVVLTQAGLEEILRHLSDSLHDRSSDLDFTAALVPGAVPAAEKKEAPAGGVILRIVRTFPNPRMLLAATAAGLRVTVQVKSNKNFRPGMVVHARQIRPDRYEQEGRCPRFPGRY